MHSDRRALLIGQIFAVQAEHQHGQRMHRLIHAQALAVGPVEHALALPRHLLRVVEREELHVLRLARGSATLISSESENPIERDHHRPALHAAMPVDALLDGVQLHQRVHVDRLRLRHRPSMLTVHGRVFSVPAFRAGSPLSVPNS